MTSKRVSLHWQAVSFVALALSLAANFYVAAAYTRSALRSPVSCP